MSKEYLVNKHSKKYSVVGFLEMTNHKFVREIDLEDLY